MRPAGSSAQKQGKESGWPAVMLHSVRWTKLLLARLPGCCCQVAEAG